MQGKILMRKSMPAVLAAMGFVLLMGFAMAYAAKPPIKLKKKFTVIDIKKVVWVAVQKEGTTTLEIGRNPDSHGGGDRIFPGKVTAASAIIHNKVKIKATLTTKAPVGKVTKIYFKFFDVDDPTTSTAPIDINDPAGPPQTYGGGDNRPAAGGAALSVAEVTVLAGKDFAETTVTINSRNPGNNFKVVAATSKKYIDDVEIDPTVQNGLDDKQSFRLKSDNAKKVPKSKQSPLLSVWRKLHVEIDSMGSESTTGTSTNLAALALSDAAANWVPSQWVGFTLNPDTSQATTFTVTSNTASTITIAGGNIAAVAAVGDRYNLRWTAWNGGDDLLRGDIANPNAGALTDVFDDIYIAASIGTTSDTPETPWRYNFAKNKDPGPAVDGNIFNDWFEYDQNYRGTRIEDNDWWSVYVSGLYESLPHPYVSDNDPEAEVVISGATWIKEPNYSSVWMENQRDLAAQYGWNAAQATHAIQYTVAHEVGHQFDEYGVNHHSVEVGGVPPDIMWAKGSDPEEALIVNAPFRFSPGDMSRIRGVGSGQRP